MNYVEILWLLIGFLIGVTVLRALLPIAYRFGLKVRFLDSAWQTREVYFICLLRQFKLEGLHRAKRPASHRSAFGHPELVKRREWEARMGFEMKLFNQWAGSREFVPAAILFPSRER